MKWAQTKRYDWLIALTLFERKKLIGRRWRCLSIAIYFPSTGFISHRLDTRPLTIRPLPSSVSVSTAALFGLERILRATCSLSMRRCTSGATDAGSSFIQIIVVYSACIDIDILANGQRCQSNRQWVCLCKYILLLFLFMARIIVTMH